MDKSIPLVNFSNKGEVLKNIEYETEGRDREDGGVGEVNAYLQNISRRREDWSGQCLEKSQISKVKSVATALMYKCHHLRKVLPLVKRMMSSVVKGDKADDSQTGLTRQKHNVPAVICPTSSYDDGNGEAQGKGLVKLRELGGARKSWFSTNQPLKQYQRRRFSASPGVKGPAKELCVEERQAECIQTIVGADGGEVT